MLNSIFYWRWLRLEVSGSVAGLLLGALEARTLQAILNINVVEAKRASHVI
jgi:hypothetical protein